MKLNGVVETAAWVVFRAAAEIAREVWAGRSNQRYDYDDPDGAADGMLKALRARRGRERA